MSTLIFVEPKKSPVTFFPSMQNIVEKKNIFRTQIQKVLEVFLGHLWPKNVHKSTFQDATFHEISGISVGDTTISVNSKFISPFYMDV